MLRQTCRLPVSYQDTCGIATSTAKAGLFAAYARASKDCRELRPRISDSISQPFVSWCASFVICLQLSRGLSSMLEIFADLRGPGKTGPCADKKRR